MRTSIASLDGRFLLKQATDAEFRAVVEAIYRSAPKWAAGFSFDAFLEGRKLHVGKQDGNGLMWVLYTVPDTEPGDLLATCQTWQTPVYYCPPGSDIVSERSCINVGDVFVAETARGGGFSFTMLNLLKELCQGDDNLFALGVTDDKVGFYERLAVQKIPSNQTIWPAELLLKHPEPHAVASLGREDLERICAVDSHLMAGELPSSGPLDAARVAVVPSVDIFKLICGIADINCEFKSSLSPARIVGAEIMQSHETAFCLWTRDFQRKRLQVLRLRANSRKDLVALIGAAQQYALENDLQSVVAWNVQGKLLSGNEASHKRTEHVWDLLPLAIDCEKGGRLVFHAAEAYAAQSIESIKG